MSIPLLPGYSSVLLGDTSVVLQLNFLTTKKKNFTKPQAFTFRNGVRSFEDAKPGIGGQPLPNTKPSSPPQKLTKIRPQLPPELRGIKGVKFDAYFIEEVHNSIEKSRIRKCQIHFYLEDGSITVLEPKVKNSGIPQGVLMRRTRVPKGEKTFLELEDMFLGAQVEIFGKKMTLVNTDQESRVSYKDLDKFYRALWNFGV